MPPTPFHPTHTTPFKSSISSSQQARKRDNFNSNVFPKGNENENAQWPVQIDANQLDARHWTYLAEGGKNLILRYTGPDYYPFVNPKNGKRIALRIGKSSRQQVTSGQSSSSTSSTTIEAQQDVKNEEEIDPSDWQQRILLPNFSSLQNQDLLPPLIRIQPTSDPTVLRSFLRMIVSKIEGFRPIDRRRKSGIDAENPVDIFSLEDLSAPIPKHPCLLLEIKPKCGFLPKDKINSVKLNEWKKQISRFRMHSVLKSGGNVSKEEFDALYDPLDLYSGQPESVEKATAALYTAWQQGKGNNLRIFMDGKRVESPSTLVEGQAGILEEAERLAKQLWKDENLNITKAIQHTLSSKEVQSVLSSLSDLQQKYDPIDVEGVEYESQKREGKGLTECGDEAAISLTEYESMVNKMKQTNNESIEHLSLRELIAALLLSTSLKDCSLFIRINDGEQEPIIQTHLVDLDPKPITKLPYLLSIDREISTIFSKWATENDYQIKS